MKKTIQVLCLLIAMASCKNGEANKTNYKDDAQTLKELTVKWNDCLVRQDLQTLSELYAEQVSVYGVSISRLQAVENKEAFFEKNKDFNQSIPGDISLVKVTENQYKAVFPKRSTFQGKTIDVEGYLLFDRVDGKWKITNESDNVTDKNITKIKTAAKSSGPLVGANINGDFDGDGSTEDAYSVKTAEGYGNPMEDGTSDAYEIRFSDKSMQALAVGCCGSTLINEGDLNNDGTDEFTVVQSSNGCSLDITTFTYSKGKWRALFDGILFSAGCAKISDKELQSLVTVENGTVYYREPDPNDEDFLTADGNHIRFNRLRKIKARLK